MTVKKNVTLLAIDRGTVIAHFKVNFKVYEVSIHNVLHVLDLTFNLISLAKLDKKGVEFRSRGERCFLLHNNVIFGEGTRVDDQWLMNVSISVQTTNLAINKTDIKGTTYT